MNRSTEALHRRLPLALLPAASSLLLAASGAHAQSANCDKLRQTLAARIEAGGISGYGLDILPAKDGTPAGGKVIGTCDGGAFKAVYRRFGGSSATGSPPPTPSEAPAPTRVAAGPPPAPAPGPAPTPPSPPPPPSPQPAPSPPPPAPAPAPPPVVSPVIITAAEPATTVAAASSAPATLTLASATRDPLSLPSVALAPVDTPSWLQRTRHWVGGEWRWLWALLLVLPVALWLGSWVQHRRQYDAAGLPRGPRL